MRWTWLDYVSAWTWQLELRRNYLLMVWMINRGLSCKGHGMHHQRAAIKSTWMLRLGKGQRQLAGLKGIEWVSH